MHELYQSESDEYRQKSVHKPTAKLTADEIIFWITLFIVIVLIGYSLK